MSFMLENINALGVSPLRSRNKTQLEPLDIFRDKRQCMDSNQKNDQQKKKKAPQPRAACIEPA
jgi:hypothetical protein